MKKFYIKILITLGFLLFFTFLPQIIPTPVSIAQASEIEKEKNKGPKLSLKSLTLATEKSYSLRVYGIDDDTKVSFKSSNPDVASVNEDGNIFANKVGTATITASLKRGLTTTPLTCDITVGPPAFSVKLTRARTILEVDQVVQLETIIKPINTVEQAKFVSYHSSIATVSTGGRVTGKKLGMAIVEAQIDATNSDGSIKSSPCNVIVAKSDDIPLLNDYFALHPELNDIPEGELSNALFEIINEYYSEEDITDKEALTLVSSEAQNTQGSIETDASINASTPSTRTSPSKDTTEASTTTTTQNGPSLIELLDDHLNSKFNLADLKQNYNERIQIPTEIQLSALFSFGSLIRR